MPATDFAQWAIPDLELTLGGRTYSVRPPSVDAAAKVLAAAAYLEVRLGIVAELPEEIKTVLDAFGPDDHPGLGAVHAQLVADEVDLETIDRMNCYSILYWVKGKDYADALAALLWAPREPVEGEAVGEAPKAS